MKKKLVSFIMAIVVVTSASAGVFAHPGRTDSSGGHYNHATGEYHYHNGGGSGSSSSSGSSGTSSRSKSTSSAKWKGNKYWDGNKYVTGFQTISGKKYCFDDRGNLYKDKWVTDDDGNSYYINDSGRVCTGWVTVGGKKYYLGNDGCARHGFRQIDGHVYHFCDDGAMSTGWETIDGSTFYFKNSGERVTGSVKINGKSYTFDSSGRLKSGTVPADNSSAKSTSLTWGMTQDEVIECKGLTDYVLEDNMIITTGTDIMDCYLFDDNGLYGYGKAAAYSVSRLKSFQKSLVNNDWVMIDSSEDDGMELLYFAKDGHLTILYYDEDTVMQIRYSDSYWN